MTEWEGAVVEVWPDGDTFTVDLRREGDPDLLAEYSMRECGITVEEGDLLIVRKDSVVKRNLGRWTQEDIDAITERARVRARKLQGLTG